MSEPLRMTATPSHPTILIGYGSYGRKVLRRLLIDAEGHGLLTWEDPPGAGSPSQRRLKDIVLIHVPDQHESDEIESYIAKDLFRQIRTSALHESELKKYVIEGKKQLLDEAARSMDLGRLRLGLDVVVLAQPASVEALGTLERILPPTMHELASDVGLRQPAQGSARVNFIMAFDFENYWDQSPAGCRIRRETGSSIKRWEKRSLEGLPSFGRIYLLDSHTAGGNRDESLRIEELTLFLELLLFAGVRDNPSLRNLYQPDNDRVPPLGTFGLRLIERSQELLKRLVAAYFGLGWLVHMAGSQASIQARSQLQNGLEEFRPASLDLSELRLELAQRLQAGISGIEKDLERLKPDDENWPQQFRDQLALSTMRLKSKLANWAGDHVQQVIDTRLKDMPKRVQEAIDRALHDEAAPTPLGTVIQELDGLEKDLQSAVATSKPAAEDHSKGVDSLQTIDAIHNDYLAFKHSQINPSRLLDWWVLLAIILAVAWTPAVLEALEELPPPGPNTLPLLSAGYEMLSWMGKPIIIAPLLAMTAWCAGRYWFHRSIQARIERGLLTFTHPERGWIISRVRAVLYTSSFRASLEGYAEEVFENMVRRLRGVVQRAIHQALERLESRRKELEWLRTELRAFLGSYGLDPDKPIETWGAAWGHRPGYRNSLEGVEDFQRMLKVNPPTKERFESTQSRLKPFTDWERRYSNAFLYPVIFLERLCREYEDSGKSRESLMPNQLNDSLTRFSGFSCAMEWDAGAGPRSDVVESYCIMPESWRSLAGVDGVLSREGITRPHIILGADSSRAYLLRFQLRVSSERLQDSREV